MGRPPAYIFVVRHGIRLDAADKQWHLSSPTPYDPPLTYGGWSHSRALGARIGEILRERILENETPALPNDSQRKPRRFKVVIHSSPFLRCVQTSTAIAAGISSNAHPLQSSASNNPLVEVTRPTPEPTPRAKPKMAVETVPDSYFLHQNEAQAKDRRSNKSVLRLDAFLGEWLSPGYFELITPPPGSVMMIASAKAELLRKENYQSYPHIQAQNQVQTQPTSPGQLWGSVPRSSPLAERPPGQDGLNGLSSMSGMVSALPRRDSVESNGSDFMSRRGRALSGAVRPINGGYAAPLPTFAVSSNAPIPSGYVAHARDACLHVDYQWDSMRLPYDWGHGGEFGEEWASMHQRFRKGIQRLVDWHSTTDNPTEMVTKPARNGTKNAGPTDDLETTDADDLDTESVVILVSHGAGCNAMIGAITNQPVLMDVGMSSLTMAARKPGKVAVPNGSTLLNGSSKNAISTPSSAVANGAVPLHEYYDLKLFANTDHLRSTTSTPTSSRSPSMASVFGGNRGRHSNSISAALDSFSYADGGASRSSSANAAVGTSPRRGSGLSSTPRVSGGITVGSGITSFAHSGLARTPSMGLWSPIIKQDDDPFENDDDMEILLNFSHNKPLSTRTVDDIAPDEFGDNYEETPAAVSTDSAIEESDTTEALPQLGLGAGGLWGSPRRRGDVERLRELSSPKRRWTVNERA